MRLLTYLSITLLLFSCSSDAIDPSAIVGTWKVVEVLADPGDGSGTFVPVESNKTITFASDNTFLSNGNLCSFASVTPVTTEGTFSKEKEEIYPNTCENFAGTTLNYKMKNGSLVVNYFCIEGCAEKYIKLRLE